MRIFIAILWLAVAGVSRAELELSDGTVLLDSPFWIVSYIEVGVGLEGQAKELLSEQVESSRLEGGSLRFEAIQRIGRPNHFVLLEAWENSQSRAAHAAARHTRTFREALQPLLYAPYDERPHYALESARLLEQPQDDAVYVITHADVVPPEQFPPCNRRPDPAGPCGNGLIVELAQQSRDHGGNLSFDVLTQANRGNHMTVVEIWENADAQSVHQSHPETKAFREAIMGLEVGEGVPEDPQFLPNPLLGSLWDERLYRRF